MKINSWTKLSSLLWCSFSWKCCFVMLLIRCSANNACVKTKTFAVNDFVRLQQILFTIPGVYFSFSSSEGNLAFCCVGALLWVLQPFSVRLTFAKLIFFSNECVTKIPIAMGWGECKLFFSSFGKCCIGNNAWTQNGAICS